MVGHSVLKAMRQIVLSHGYGVRGQETRTVSISLTRKHALKSLWTTPFLHIHAKLKHVLINYLIKIHMHALFYFMKHYLLILIDGHIFVIIGIQAEIQFE